MQRKNKQTNKQTKILIIITTLVLDLSHFELWCTSKRWVFIETVLGLVYIQISTSDESLHSIDNKNSITWCMRWKCREYML